MEMIEMDISELHEDLGCLRNDLYDTVYAANLQPDDLNKCERALKLLTQASLLIEGI